MAGCLMFRVIAWSGTVLLGSLLVDGCGKIENPRLPGLLEPARDAGPASRDDAGSGPSGDATAGFVCPAAEPGYEPGEAWWGRDLDTGHCCAYSDSGAIPQPMAAFRTEEDCLNDCRCNTVDR